MKTPITFLEYMDIKSWTTMAIAYHAWYAKIENSGIFQVVSTFLKNLGVDRKVGKFANRQKRAVTMYPSGVKLGSK